MKKACFSSFSMHALPCLSVCDLTADSKDISLFYSTLPCVLQLFVTTSTFDIGVCHVLCAVSWLIVNVSRES